MPGWPLHALEMLHLAFDGASGSTSFPNLSPQGGSAVVTGSAQITTAQARWGGASYQGAAGAYLTFDGAGYALNLRDYSIEGWFRIGALAGQQYLFDVRTSDAASDTYVHVDANGALTIKLLGATSVTSNGAVVAGNWHHLAVSHRITSFTTPTSGSWETGAWLDGVRVGSVSGGGSFGATSTRFRFGADFAGNNALTGQLDDWRVVRAALFDRNFSTIGVPTAPYPTAFGWIGGVQPAVPRSVLFPAAATEPRSFRSPGPVRMVDYGGLGRVAGTVKVKGSPDYPVRRRVRLVRERDAVCIGEVWSHATTGAYEFVGVDPVERYTVLAYDGPRVLRAAVQDYVLPEPWVPA